MKIASTTLTPNTLTPLESKLVQFIISEIDENDLIKLRNKLFERYRLDASNTLEHYPTTKIVKRIKPQKHRYGNDEAFVEVFGDECLNSTSPKGEVYTLHKTGNLTLSHYLVNADETIRTAKHRREIAKKNTIIEPYTVDMWDENANAQIKASLHVAVLVKHQDAEPRHSMEPQGIFIEIPYSDWTGSHLLLRIDEFIRLYSVSTIEDLDFALPELKQAMRTEELSNSGE